MRSINPFTEEVSAEYPEHNQQQVEQLLEQAEGAFAEWRAFSFDHRGELLRRVGELLLEQKADLSTLMVREMGKTIGGAEAEIEKCATACEYFANHAPRLLAAQEIPTDASHSYVSFHPLGPILAIMPWNFPFWQVFRFAAPSLMAGNVAVLKHAWNVPGCGLAIERIFSEAGFPGGVFTNLLLDNNAAEALIGHPKIRAVTLTGSERAGKAVGSAAGRFIKKSVLELGGSDPFIVCRDVNVAATAAAAAGARNINAGQSCIAAKRFIVHESIAGEFERAFADRMASLRMGDPMDRKTDIGPLARADLRDALDDQVKRTVAAGAKILVGGNRPNMRGFFYPPTVLVNVRPGMAAFDEETFGPVAAVTRVDSTQEAIELANHSRFGLGASVWTNDIAGAEKIASQIESGCVFVNGAVKSDPRLPFGGVKSSGYGRELAEVGIREFVNIKSVWIK
jgi:succinate-semialdehyde dehydrogenase/glutarate-semialdehyde dehydrogenase